MHTKGLLAQECKKVQDSIQLSISFLLLLCVLLVGHMSNTCLLRFLGNLAFSPVDLIVFYLSSCDLQVALYGKRTTQIDIFHDKGLEIR